MPTLIHNNLLKYVQSIKNANTTDLSGELFRELPSSIARAAHTPVLAARATCEHVWSIHLDCLPYIDTITGIRLPITPLTRRSNQILFFLLSTRVAFYVRFLKLTVGFFGVWFWIRFCVRVGFLSEWSSVCDVLWNVSSAADFCELSSSGKWYFY